MLDNYVGIINGLILLVVSGVGGYVINYFRTRKKTVDRNTENIAELKDEVIDIKRVLVMVAKRLDKGSKKYHNDLDADYEELVKDILIDEILSDKKTAI